jgi:glycosyltransferase involved in cell wall biosynthesis
MKLAVDVSSAAKPDPTGIGRYAVELVRAAAPLFEPSDDVQLVVRRSRWKQREWIMPLAVSTGCRGPAWIAGICPGWFSGRVEIYHSTDVALPRGLRSLSIATIHDTNTLDDETLASARWVRERSEKTRRVAERADMVFAVSEFGRDRILHHFPAIGPERVRVTPLGYDHVVSPEGARLSPRPVPSDDFVLARHGLTRGRYVLAVGRVERRKNPDGLVRAFARAKAAADQTLVFAGPLGDSEVDVAIRESNCRERIRFLGRVLDEELGALYRGATIFALPSRYEGFGIPLLEALACGTPSIASNRSAQPEVAGDAALLVCPDDVDEIASALDRLWVDEALRRTLRARGPVQARRFTWETCARATLEGYRQLLALGPR